MGQPCIRAVWFLQLSTSRHCKILLPTLYAMSATSYNARLSGISTVLFVCAPKHYPLLLKLDCCKGLVYNVTSRLNGDRDHLSVFNLVLLPLEA